MHVNASPPPHLDSGGHVQPPSAVAVMVAMFIRAQSFENFLGNTIVSLCAFFDEKISRIFI